MKYFFLYLSLLLFLVLGSCQERKLADKRLARVNNYVLYLSDMPSLLLEADFLTHRGGAKRLRDPDYLGAMAREVADALGRFRSAAVVAGHAP